jgi:Zn-dependent M28 family amino/carboxypeptidase
MAVPGEEQGLLGAAYFAEQAKQKGMNIEAMFTNDIIGGVTSYKNSPTRQTVRVFAEGVPSDETEQQAATRRSVGGENDSPARQLARFIKDVGDVYSPRFRVNVIYRRDRYGRGGDHIPFLERGFAAVRFTEPNEDYTHQHQNVRTENGVFYGDTPEFVDFDYVANVARVNVASLASLALAPGKPKNVGIVTGRLTNDTDLKWDANAEADLAGYEIVWRETNQPFWTNSQFVGNATNSTMKEMSKDNYFFGVRAVDKAGNKSPVVFPRPAAQTRPNTNR